MVVYSHIVINPKTMKSRRYGFVEYRDYEPVKQLLAVENLLFRNKKVIISSFIENKAEMEA